VSNHVLGLLSLAGRTTVLTPILTLTFLALVCEDWTLRYYILEH